ncbi:MAG: LytR C-terminal domain-containing protein [Bacteroidota bacterium]
MTSIEQPDPSSEEPQDLSESQPTSTFSERFLPGRTIRLVTACGVILGFIVLVILANRNPGAPEQNKAGPAGVERPIQVEVLNGTTEGKLALRMTDFLRAKGFDVVDMANYKTQSLVNTMVIDRTGNLKNAKAVAEALGVEETRVVQQIDKNLYLEVSVVIGKDYPQLKPFQ